MILPAPDLEVDPGVVRRLLRHLAAASGDLRLAEHVIDDQLDSEFASIAQRLDACPTD